MKKVMVIILSMLLIVTVGCEKKEKKPIDNPKLVELLEDTKFQTGINLLGTDPGRDGRTVFGKLTYNGTAKETKKPLWVSAQWCSKYNLATELEEGRSEEVLKNGFYIYEDLAKTIAINPTSGQIDLNVRTSVDYGETPRKGDQGWSHLLLEQNFPNPQPIKNLSNISVGMDFRINECELMMKPQEVDKNIHAAQFVWFITIHNTSEVDGNPNDFLWFSIPLWDNRGIKKQDTTAFDKGTGHYMSGPNPFIYLGKYRDREDYNTEYFYLPIQQRISFEIDILPYVESAFYNAQKAGGLVGCKLENMAVDYMNVGWEIPGTYDVSATIYNMSINGIKK